MRLLALVLALALSLAGVGAHAQELDRIERSAPDWTGRVFVPSFDFPTSPPQLDNHPWRSVDFRTDPESYMAVVLAYILEGQDRITWRVQDNPRRRWYHAPWMGPGPSGREFINGLTRERSSRPYELGSGQVKCRQNWAVGFYNPEAAVVFGRLWAPVRNGTGAPDLSALPFPVGSVAAKLLFTEADTSEVPLLAGAPELRANIHLDNIPNDTACAPATVRDAAGHDIPAPRSPATLRLLQLDIAVRDERADTTTGWVFGTFVYDGRLFGADPWRKLRPVGLMWGNDPGLTDTLAATGGRPAESIVLSDFGLHRVFGRGNRMNGPIDNPASTCISCHMTAQVPDPQPRIVPDRDEVWDGASCWFRNLGPTTPFGRPPSNGVTCGSVPSGETRTSLDFSLQLAIGIRNWQSAHAASAAASAPSPGLAPLSAGSTEAVLERVIRENPAGNFPITRGDSPANP